MSYSHYRGRCIGRILHFLDQYCPYHIASVVRVGGNRVTLSDRPFATIAWDTSFGHAGVPVFTFLEDTDGAFARAQESRRHVAITDGLALAPPAFDRYADRVLRVLMPDAIRRIELWTELSCSVKPTYAIDTKRLYAEIPGRVWAWDAAIGDWLLWYEERRVSPTGGAA